MVPIISRKRRDLQGLPAVSGESPVLGQLRLVSCRPLHDEAEGTRGDAAVEDGQRPDVDFDLAALVGRMEVRRVVIPVVDGDHDPVEATDFGHRETVRRRPALGLTGTAAACVGTPDPR